MKFATQLQERLGKEGVFLISGSKEHFNGMTISWGHAGVMWGKEVIIAPIRTTRHTYSFLRESGCFTICIPKYDMKKELALFGSRSGRDCDKFREAGLKPIPCKKIDCTALPDCFVYECKIVYSQTLNPESLSDELRTRWYEHDAVHTLFYGEIIAEYET